MTDLPPCFVLDEEAAARFARIADRRGLPIIAALLRDALEASRNGEPLDARALALCSLAIADIDDL